MSEVDVRAYWSHWYKLATKGKYFTFEKVGDYKPDEDGDGDLGGVEGIEDDLAGD